MDIKSSSSNTIDALNKEYEVYINDLRYRWLKKNRVYSKNVLEVMDSFERELVEKCIARWEEYITPLAEVWWKKRGYGVIWPDDNSKPMKVYKLETTLTK
jgi:hypothetical protein